MGEKREERAFNGHSHLGIQVLKFVQGAVKDKAQSKTAKFAHEDVPLLAIFWVRILAGANKPQ